MAGGYKKIYIKNSGMLVAFVTFFWGMWYTICDLFVIAGDSGLLLRICGVMCITILAYLPYSFLYHKTSGISHHFFVISLVGAVLCSDLFVRIAVFCIFAQTSGFFFIVVYPLMLMVCVWFILLCIQCMGRIATGKKIIAIFVAR